MQPYVVTSPLVMKEKTKGPTIIRKKKMAFESENKNESSKEHRKEDEVFISTKRIVDELGI